MVNNVVKVDFAGKESIVDMVSYITDLIEEDNIKSLAIVIVDKNQLCPLFASVKFMTVYLFIQDNCRMNSRH